MQQNETGGSYSSPLPVFAVWLFNSISILDKSTISFMLGVIVSAMAIINYWIQIRKNLKK